MNLYKLYLEQSCDNCDNGYCIAKHTCNYRCSERCRSYENNGIWDDYESWEDAYYEERDFDWDYYNNGDYEC